MFPKVVFATIVFTISNPVVNGNDEIEVDASVTGLISSSCSTSGCYLQSQLRIFDETREFFGYTYNNSGEYINYFSSVSSTDEIKVKLFNFVPISGAWSGKIKAKNNINDANYIGPGQYKLKFRRFSGNSITATSGDSNEINVNLVMATPSPTPSPTPTPTDSPTQAPTQTSTASSTKSPLPTPTKTASPKPTSTPTEKPTEESFVLEPQVLSLSTIASSPEPEITENKKSPILAIILIISGIGCLGYGGYLLYNMKNAKNH